MADCPPAGIMQSPQTLVGGRGLAFGLHQLWHHLLGQSIFVKLSGHWLWEVTLVISPHALLTGIPLGQAWLLLLHLQSHWASLVGQGKAGSTGEGEVISTQLEAGVSLRTSLSMKETTGSIAQ